MRPSNTPERPAVTLADPSRDLRPSDLTPEQIDHYMRRGRKIRAQAAADGARWVSVGLRRLFAGSGTSTQPDEASIPSAPASLAYKLRTTLTSIRSSAEILRDCPEIDTAERNRFLDIVLKEEERLEKLLPQILGTVGQERRSRA